jgi:hypothetical protein
MKTFDRNKEDNLAYYHDSAYKVITADRAVDVGLYDEVASKAMLKQRLIITFSRKMLEYQRYSALIKEH